MMRKGLHLVPLFIFFCLPAILLGEGTKQVRPVSSDGGALQVRTTSYTPFATIGCPANYRLYIHIKQLDETILFGLNTSSFGNVNYNLRDPSGNVVLTGICPSPTNGQPGLISTYDQAVIGPFPALGGYTPISYKVTNPAALGDYYIDFSSNDVSFDPFDFTVVTGVNDPPLSTDVINGRVYSQAWQFNSSLGSSFPPVPYTPFSGSFYIYSDDGIITKCAFNHDAVGIFTLLCNEVGVQITGNFNVDRMSRNNNTTQTYPAIAQYKVFFNNPDSTVYPSGVYGMMIGTPVIIPDPNYPPCSGRKYIIIEVNKDGKIEIFIDVPYGGSANDRSLFADASAGVNNIPWDGKDGLGNQVPDGTEITVTVTYVNGLTNLPLWDIEQNPFGFAVSLIRPINPALENPLVYWDDSQITGGSFCPSGTNFPGCTPSFTPPVTGCHVWSTGITGDDCHNKMINTWWYSASSSTATINVYYTGTPPNPVPHGSYRCGAGPDSIWVHVLASETADWYDAPAGGNLILAGDTLVVFPNLTATTTYWAEARNDTSGCLSVSRVPVTDSIRIVPDVIFNPPALSICSSDTVNIFLSSVAPDPVFTWTCTPSSGNVSGYSPGSGTTVISQKLTNSGSVPEFVTYHVTAVAHGCSSPGIYDVTAFINPRPVPNMNPMSKTICSGDQANISLTSTIAAATFTWNSSVISGTVSGNTNGSGNLINDLLINALATPGIVEYVIHSAVGGCTGNDTSYFVTVNPHAVPTITGPAGVCVGISGNTYSTQAGMTGYTWSVAPDGLITSGAGTSSVQVTWNSIGVKTVSVNYNNSYGCDALTPGSFSVTVNPLPVPVISGPASVCVNVPGYLFSTQPGMTGYTWSISPGGVIASGAGTNTVTASWGITGPQWISVNYFNANGCTAVNPAVYNVTVNTRPVPTLTGQDSVCVNSSAVYTTEAGMTNYAWGVTGGNIISGGGSGNNTATILWTVTGTGSVSVNYFNGNGCTAVNPTNKNVTVKPRPAVTNAGASAVCSGGFISIPVQANLPGTTFTWVASSGSPDISGYHNGGGPVITDVLINSGFTPGTVTYTVTPSLNGCDGSTADFIVTVFPVADVYFIPNGQTICSGQMTAITLHSNVTGASFSWTVSGSTPGITGCGPGGGTNIIAQTLTNTTFTTGYVTYSVLPSANGCIGTPDTVHVTVNPLPPASLTLCNDPVTLLSAQPFRLKGGIPLGGTYSGAGVNAGFFYPALAGPGNHAITYTYINMYGCSASGSVTINVQNAGPFTCGNNLTDIRDGKIYRTVMIGPQCWLAVNLNYGNSIASSSMQRDNCLPEKYCFNDNPANCASQGGFYQWDEMMQYENTAGSQGFCPPGWHVPTENEWNTLFSVYITSGFAGAPLKYTGYSGFNALLDGTRFLNQTWSFSGFATMIWSSTSHGPYKAWAHGMNTYNPSVSYYPAYRHNAFVVRCLHD